MGSRIKRLTGYLPDYYIGKYISDLLHDDDKEETISRIMTLEANQHFRHCYRLKTTYPECFVTVEANISVFGNKDDLTELGVLRDVTERTKNDRVTLEEFTTGLYDYEQLISTAAAPIFGVDTNLNINVWNRKAVEITGYTYNEVGGTPILDLIEERYKESVKDVLEKALNQENTVNYQQELVTKDGNRVTLILNATVRKSSGVISGVIGVAQDITEMIRLQEEKDEAKKLMQRDNYSKMFDNLKDAFAWIYEVDLKSYNGSYVFVTEGATNVMGFSREDMMLNSSILSEILLEDEYNRYLSYMMQFSKGNIKYSSQEYLLKNNNRVMINVVLTEHTEEKMVFEGITIDMPEKVNLDMILDRSFDLIMILNSDRNIEYTSDPELLTGYNRYDFAKRSLISMCHPDDRGYMQKMLDDPSATLFEWRLMTADNIWKAVETSKTPFSNDKELTITRDLTDRKARHKAETDLAVQTKAREKDLDASRVSRHEFKNGLMAFKSIVNGMMDIISENASSKSFALITDRTGPKISSLYILIFFFT